MTRRPIRPGDRVRLTAAFLINTGQRVSNEGAKVWTVQAVQGDFVVTDEAGGFDSYWTLEELAADPLLRFRRIHAGNLVQVGEMDVSKIMQESNEYRKARKP